MKINASFLYFPLAFIMYISFVITLTSITIRLKLILWCCLWLYGLCLLSHV